MPRVEFRLAMPKRGSWNGRWSGEDKNYVVYENMSTKKIKELKLDTNKQRWSYYWEDGWGASITGRIMETGERRQKPDGFCGYGWMVDSIISHGEIKKPGNNASYDDRKETT